MFVLYLKLAVLEVNGIYQSRKSAGELTLTKTAFYDSNLTSTEIEVLTTELKDILNNNYKNIRTLDLKHYP